MSRPQPFLNIRTEGSLLPSDVLSRLMEGANLPGLKPEDYHLGAGEKLNEAISRSWSRLLSLWSAFRKAQNLLSLTDLGTTLTRERWLLQLFQELGYGRLVTVSAIEIDGKTYPVSHLWHGQYYQVPIHLVSFRADLDKRSDQRIQGASKASPHGMVQEFLNRSEHYLWALVSNGLKLLILRDNASLTRQAYVEFDLEGIFEGEAYSDFRLLWMLCHQSRLEGTAQDRPETCWLEVWSKQAQTDGRRALDQLRVGVQKALENLGTGFIAHKANQSLRVRLQAGELQKQDFYRQLLRLVYRLIFLFVAEDRDLLHSPVGPSEARSRYAKFYSGQRLRRMAERTRGSLHADLWVGLRLVFSRLGHDRGCPELGLPVLGGFLFGQEAMPDLEAADLSNEYLLQAVRNLGLIKDRSGWRLVDYRNLGSEELGSVYESLLELNPTMELDAGVFTLGTVAGNQRKTSGSYYTHDSLVQCLLDSALDPVVNEAIRGKSPVEAERAILALKVCDPAVGSGHFLVGAAHRLAGHLARVRALAQGESEPSPLYYQHALRDVIGRCLYGVDVNPMAAELCRVSLWLEAIEPGKPLSFLDHHIRVGNSLLGATPALLAKGIPDEAFTPIEGDDKEVCKYFKKVNKDEKKGQGRLFAASTEPWKRLRDLAVRMAHLDVAPDDSIEAIREKERMYAEMVSSGGYLEGQFWADAWCAAFVWKKTREFNYPISEEVFRRIEHNPHSVDPWMRDEIQRLSRDYQFFHWHLAFPDVFHVPPSGQASENDQAGWNGGFDVVLGNPPWEKIQSEEQGFFASYSSEISDAVGGSRKRLIEQLKNTDPRLHEAWLSHRRRTEAVDLFVKGSGRYPHTGCGKLNTYAVFAEHGMSLAAREGACGQILPLGIVTDDNTKVFFWDIMSKGKLASLYGFENEEFIFPEVHHSFKFCLLTAFNQGRADRKADFTFYCRDIADLIEDDRHCPMTAAEIELINPNTKNCPTFRLRQDFEIVRSIYTRVPIMVSETAESPWSIELHRIINPTDDSELMLKKVPEDPRANTLEIDDKSYLRVYEGKMIHQFDHRFGSYLCQTQAQSNQGKLPELSTEEHLDPLYLSQPQFWIPTSVIDPWLSQHSHRNWLCVFRDITSAVVLRTCISAIIPRVGPVDPCRCIFFPDTIAAASACSFIGALNSFVFDFVARQSVSGTHLAIFIMKQLPVPSPSCFQKATWSSENTAEWVYHRVFELTYTAWDLEPFAQDCGWSGPPFRWDEDRRFLLRCELDAAFFHLYLPSEANGDWSPTDNEMAEDRARLTASFPTPRDAVAYIMDTFPIVKRKDEGKWGEYRTKRVILDMYDGMAKAARTGIPYQTRLDPPPADPSCRHPKKKIGIRAFGSLITDPGPELHPHIAMRIKTHSVFPVEYARISQTRGGAPTLVPYESGAPVSAEILALDDDISIEEAKNMLWRRERRREGTGETYTGGTGENFVLVEQFHDDPCVSTVLYTDFNTSGKISHPTAADLAKKAIESVAAAPEGRDGITYLMDAIRSGIETPLTADYKAEILKQTTTLTLEEALKTVKDRR